MDLAHYKLLALACTLVVFAYVLFNLFDALRQWSAIERAKKNARDARLRSAHRPTAAGAVSRSIEPERVTRVALRSLPASDATDTNRLLHPTGACACAGEGVCAWCLFDQAREARSHSKREAA